MHFWRAGWWALVWFMDMRYEIVWDRLERYAMNCMYTPFIVLRPYSILLDEAWMVEVRCLVAVMLNLMLTYFSQPCHGILTVA